MSILVALLAIQALPPPPPSGADLPPGAVELPAVIHGNVRTYDRCIRDGISERGTSYPGDVERYRRAADAAIGACAEVKAREMTLADRMLARTSGFAEAQTRDRALRHAFDGTDYQHRHLPEILAPQLAAMAARPRLPTLNVPREIVEPFQIYMQCVTVAFTTLQRNRSVDPSAMRARTLSDCRTVRNVQLDRAHVLIADARRYGGAENARAAATQLFDYFDNDYPIEDMLAPPPPPPQSAPKGQDG